MYDYWIVNDHIEVPLRRYTPSFIAERTRVARLHERTMHDPW